LPKLYANGVLLVGDAAGLVNPVNREGANLAMISGQLAAETVKYARERDDASIVTLSRYRELLDDSIVMKDLFKIRNTTDFAHRRPHLFTDYPEMMSEVARTYLTVDGAPKSVKMKKIGKLLRSQSKRRLLSDAIGTINTMLR